MLIPPGELGVTAVIVDSIPLVRDALGRILARDCAIQVVGRSADLNAGLACIHAFQPALAVLDGDLLHDNLRDVLGAINRCSPRTRVVLMLTCCDDEQILRGLAAGAYRCAPRAAALEALRALFWRLAGRPAYGPAPSPASSDSARPVVQLL